MAQGKIIEGEVKNRCRGYLLNRQQMVNKLAHQSAFTGLPQTGKSSISGSSRHLQARGNISLSMISSGRRYVPFRHKLLRKKMFIEDADYAVSFVCPADEKGVFISMDASPAIHEKWKGAPLMSVISSSADTKP